MSTLNDYKIGKVPIRIQTTPNAMGTIGIVCGAIAGCNSFRDDIADPLIDIGYNITTIAQPRRGFRSEAELLDANHGARDTLIKQGDWGEHNGPNAIIAQSIGVNIELLIYNDNSRTGLNSMLALTPGFPRGVQWLARNCWEGLYNTIQVTQLDLPAKCILGKKDFVNGTGGIFPKLDQFYETRLRNYTTQLESNGWEVDIWDSGHLLNNNRFNILGIGLTHPGKIPQEVINLISQTRNS